MPELFSMCMVRPDKLTQIKVNQGHFLINRLANERQSMPFLFLKVKTLNFRDNKTILEFIYAD